MAGEISTTFLPVKYSRVVVTSLYCSMRFHQISDGKLKYILSELESAAFTAWKLACISNSCSASKLCVCTKSLFNGKPPYWTICLVAFRQYQINVQFISVYITVFHSTF